MQMNLEMIDACLILIIGKQGTITNTLSNFLEYSEIAESKTEENIFPTEEATLFERYFDFTFDSTADSFGNDAQ
jgi:hypothetical protein